MAYATGKYSFAICDRCGFKKKYNEIKEEWTGFRVCSECYEPKSPQLESRKHVVDPEALRFPRPQVASSTVAGAGVVRTIDPNQMITVTGDSIGSSFDSESAEGEVGTVTVVIT
jgi:hypothetical protein